MKLLACMFGVISLFWSCREKQIKKKKISNNIVEAKFINDSVIDGLAKVYDLKGNLMAKINYTNGIRNGITLLFHNNGKIKDSMNYINDLLQGQSFKYNSNGNIERIRTNYYGIEVADFLYYRNSFINQYYFIDFNKRTLVSCNYNSLGKSDSIYFNANPIFGEKYSEGNKEMINIFFFFPHPPDYETTYTIGTINSSNRIENKTFLNSNRLFLDTTFFLPEKPKKFFIDITYKNISNDTTINMYYKQF